MGWQTSDRQRSDCGPDVRLATARLPDGVRLRGFAPSREAEKIGETDTDENAADYLEISPFYSCTP